MKKKKKCRTLAHSLNEEGNNEASIKSNQAALRKKAKKNTGGGGEAVAVADVDDEVLAVAAAVFASTRPQQHTDRHTETGTASIAGVGWCLVIARRRRRSLINVSG